MQAMVIWDQKYSDEPSTAVQHFVYDLKNAVDPKANIRGAHLNLIRSASLPEKELMKDPSREIESYLNKHQLQQQAESSRPEYQALQRLIRAWQKHLSKRENQSISTYVISNISKQNINQNLSLFFVSWLAKRDEKQQNPQADIKELRKIINLFYTGCCEYIGPVKTDEILGKLVQDFKEAGGNQYRILIEQLL